MSKQTQFSLEVRERAVRIVQEQRDQYPSLWAAAVSLGPKFDCAPSTLVGWVRRWEVYQSRVVVDKRDGLYRMPCAALNRVGI